MKTHLPDEIWIGREGEQYSRSITFDISVELSMWENATPTLIYVRPGEKVAYPATTTLANGILTWIPDGFATAIRGARGFIQIVFTESADETVIIGKSKVMRMQVCESLNTSAEPPEPWESWIEDLLDAAAQATTAATNATEAAQDATDAAADARSAVQEAEATVSALNTRVTEVENELDSAERDIAGIEGRVTEIIGEVTAEGVAQVKNVKDEGTTQIGLVGAEGTRQIGLVTDAGTTQIGLIEDKINTFSGIEILDPNESPQHESTEVTLTPDAEDIDQIPQIDDTQLSSVDTWSSNKIHVEDCFEVSASGSVVTVQDGADGVAVKSMTVQIVAQQSGEGDPSPTNVRPISGFDSVTIIKAGKNLFDKTNVIAGRYIDSNGMRQTIASGYASDYIPVVPNTTYRVSQWYGSNVSRYFAFYATQSTSTFISSTIPTYTGGTFTTPSNAHYMRLSCGETYLDSLMLTVGEEAQGSYQAYNATTIPISFPSEAGTVYGGNLVINEDGSGVLTVDRGIFVIDTDTLVSQFALNRNNAGRARYVPTVRGIYNSVAGDIVCNAFKGQNSSNILNYGSSLSAGLSVAGDYIYITLTTEYTTVEKWKTLLASIGSVVVTYPLVTPVEYQLTAQQITTLFGTNNIWANTGDISFTYRADKKLYVDTRLAELRALIGG